MRDSTTLTLDQMDFDAIFQQINLNLKLYAVQNLVAKTPLVESFARRARPAENFCNPLRTFPKSFARHVLKNQDFSCYGVIFLPLHGSF